MVTLFIALGAAFGAFAASFWGADLGAGWSVFLSLLGFAAFQASFGLMLQRKVKADMMRVQSILEAGQKQLQQKMQRQRPVYR